MARLPALALLGREHLVYGRLCVSQSRWFSDNRGAELRVVGATAPSGSAAEAVCETVPHPNREQPEAD